MARTKVEIREEVKASFINNPALIELYDLTPGQTFDEQFSITSVESIWLEQYIDMIYNHELIVSANAANSRPQNLPNFRNAILSFLDGLELQWINGAFNYDTTDVEDIDERKIIKRCALIESVDNELVIKIARENAGELEPLTNLQLERFESYLRQVKVPGVKTRIINEPADLLKATLTVYVDPLIIDLTTGKLLNTTEDVEPVKVGVNNYLQNLEFNGAFVKDFFKNAITSQQGVGLVNIDEMKWKYAAFPFIDFGAFQIPQSGYFKINDADLTINYLPYVLVNS